MSSLTSLSMLATTCYAMNTLKERKWKCRYDLWSMTAFSPAFVCGHSKHVQIWLLPTSTETFCSVGCLHYTVQSILVNQQLIQFKWFALKFYIHWGKAGQHQNIYKAHGIVLGGSWKTNHLDMEHLLGCSHYEWTIRHVSPLCNVSFESLCVQKTLREEGREERKQT